MLQVAIICKEYVQAQGSATELDRPLQGKLLTPSVDYDVADNPIAYSWQRRNAKVVGVPWVATRRVFCEQYLCSAGSSTIVRAGMQAGNVTHRYALPAPMAV